LRREPISSKKVDKIVPIGQKIMFFITEGNFKGTYSSYIYDKDDDYIYVLMPTNTKGIKGILRENDSVEVSFVDDKNRFRIGFSTKVNKIIKDDKKVIYRLDKPTEIARIELRNNFRVDDLIDTNFFYFKDSKIKKEKGVIIDISAGGIKLSTDCDLETRDKLFLEFNLNNDKMSEIEGEVVRKAVTGEKDVKHYGIQFIDLDKKTENKIVKYCISKQMETLRKMKGLD